MFSVLIAAQSVIADYRKDAENGAWLFQRPWLDPRTAVTVMVAVLGLAIARDNAALSLRPYLSYSNELPKRDESPQKYFVRLRNEGTGPALIDKVRYELRFKDDDFESILEHKTVIERIDANCNLKEGLDYRLDRFSPGATIGKDKERILFEVENKAIDAFQTLRNFDVKVQYQGMLGDLYEKTVQCLSHDEERRPRTLK